MDFHAVHGLFLCVSSSSTFAATTLLGVTGNDVTIVTAEKVNSLRVLGTVTAL